MVVMMVSLLLRLLRTMRMGMLALGRWLVVHERMGLLEGGRVGLLLLLLLLMRLHLHRLHLLCQSALLMHSGGSG